MCSMTGAGCAGSGASGSTTPTPSAIAANLALGLPLEEAVARAKDYLSGALRAMLDLGAGSGPLNHAYPLTER